MGFQGASWHEKPKPSIRLSASIRSVPRQFSRCEKAGRLSPSCSSLSQSRPLLSLSLLHLVERDLQEETSRGMQCKTQCRTQCGTINGWIPAARMQFRSSPIGRASLGQVQSRWPVIISEAPAACCARTLSLVGGLEWWDMNPSTMMESRAAAALPR